MNLKLNTTFQSVLMLIQGANLVALPAKIQLIAGVLISAIQGLLALKAQFVNPDGTAATVAYRKPNGNE